MKLISGLELSKLGTKLLKGEDIELEDVLPEYAQGKASSRKTLSLDSKEVPDLPYEEFKDNGVHVRTWNEKDYEETEPEDTRLHVVQSFPPVLGFQSFNNPKPNRSVVEAFLNCETLHPKKYSAKDYNPSLDNSVELRHTRPASVGAVSFYVNKTQATDYEVEQEKAQRRSESLAREKKTRDVNSKKAYEKKRPSPTAEQKAKRALAAKARRAKAKSEKA